MHYRTEIDLRFVDKQDALDLMNYVEGIKTKAYTPKGTDKIPCRKFARYHACSHDNSVNPCSGYVNIDFDKPKAVHS